MVRVLYITGFLVFSAVAALFYYSQTRQVSALVASHDLSVGAQLGESDLTVRTVNPGSLPDGALAQPSDVIGRFVVFPLLKGSFLDRRAVADSRSTNLPATGLSLPSGQVVISLPVTPATAVGAALTPGDRVDVVAIPNGSKTGGGPDESALGAQVIGHRVLVVGLRTDQGTELETSTQAVALGNARLGSVLLAIPEGDVGLYATALLSSTFFLALSLD